MGISDFDDDLSKLVPALHELETFIHGLQAIKDMRDGRNDTVLGEEVSSIDQVLTRTHG